ncbi:MAG: hypothetical protein ACLU30_03715 [Odoribacter splanchnicus]
MKLEDITTTVVNLRDRTFSSEHLFAFNTTKLKITSKLISVGIDSDGTLAAG